ncbi:MAG: LPXTG cell wall anchor domain-containing protein, partial [Clostridia bacterium]|nr:LPXTG cell wall anchor domain-containing protein [Clostridia bacterium]
SFSATVVDINSIVTKLQLTEEEKALIEQGADMKIVFKLSDIGATINTPEKEAILNALTKGEIGTFLDIQLVKQIGGMSTNVKNLSGLISVSVELPAELINKDGNTKRSYSVLRYHDGDETKVTTLNAKFDETTGTLTFETDRFSTYAIVYSDVVVSDGEGVPGTPDPGDGEVSTPENPKDEATPGTPETPKDDVSSDKTDDSVTNDKNDASSETGTNDKNDTSKDDVPKAGVISTTSIWLGAMALSGLGALLASKKKKED